MTYQGSKEKIAPQIADFLSAARKPNQLYYEPFVGSCSVFELMKGPKIGSDAMISLIYLWNELIADSFVEPTTVSKDLYTTLMHDPKPSALQAYVGFFWSFSGLYNKGYSPTFASKSHSFYEAQQRAKRMRESQEPFVLLGQDYRDTEAEDSVIYCDIPYKGTLPYKGVPPFDHEVFYEWCFAMKKKGNQVFISEYDMPHSLGFFEVMSFPFRTSMATSQRTEYKAEKIYTL